MQKEFNWKRLLQPIPEFDALVYDPNETVRVDHGTVYTPKWKDKGEIITFGLSCTTQGCWIRTIGIIGEDRAVSMMSMEWPISAFYDNTLLICLTEPIKRERFKVIQAAMQKRIGDAGIVQNTKKMVDYPLEIALLGDRIQISALEDRLR